MASERIDIRQTTIEKAKRDAAAGVRREINDTGCRGLVLRVQPTGCVWQFRLQHEGKDRRITIGPVDLWPLAWARLTGAQIRWHVTSNHGVPDPYWIKAQRDHHVWSERMKEARPEDRALDPEPKGPPAMARQERARTWTYRRAREEWGQHLRAECAAGHLVEETVTNYLGIVGSPSMRTLDDLPVARITAADVAKVVKALVAAGKRSQGNDVVRVGKRLFGWLAQPDQEVESGVAPGVLDRLKAPRLGNVKARQTFPDLDRLGIVVATCRSGVLKPVLGTAIELLAWTSQRRLAIVRARREEFEPWPLHPGWGLWRCGHRKTPGAKASGMPHTIPLPPTAWTRMQAHLTWLDEYAPDTEWMFPSRRQRRRGQPTKTGHVGKDTITHGVPVIPGADMTPHAMRRCFSSALANSGIHLAFVGYILDHASKGSDSTQDENRMTRRYTEADLLVFKQPVMARWEELLKPAAAAAVLLPPRELKAELVRLRALRKGTDLEKEKVRIKGINARMWAEGQTTKQRARASKQA
ncbi:integrase family protein [Methylobacterium sp. J-090]|uniref:tyrosine-type recombinase/integrase n=1 Tax=Methylobacterium sp. J-090 TaxID=2836666 RepID=UPI0028BE4139|nr:integrase family protein [Methylobacterium sp. J-090]